MAPEDDYAEELKQIGSIFKHIDIDRSGTNPLKDFMTIISFLRLYIHMRPDVVLNFTPKNNIYSTIAASLRGIPVINNIAGLGTVFINEGLTARLVRRLYAISQKKASHIFFQNQVDYQLFLDAKIVSQDRASILPGSGVDLERFRPTIAPDDGVVRFVLVARMLYEKGIEEYFLAAKVLRLKYQFSEFFLLGPIDPYNPSAIQKDTILEWEKNNVIQYIGESDAVENNIGIVDCVVLPSYYREGVPRSLLEAAAMGKPVVTTNSVGCRDAVDDGESGYLCKPKNVDSLINNLEKIILMTHSDRLDMGKRGRKKMEKEFDELVVIQRYTAEISRNLRLESGR